MIYDIKSIDAQYVNGNGYMPKENRSQALKAILNYAQDAYDEGKLSEYQADDRSVFIRDRITGISYVYTAATEGTDSGNGAPSVAVYTYQPFRQSYIDERGSDYESVMQVPDECARAIADTFDSVEFPDSNNFDNDSVDLSVIDNFGANQIVIWHGHGDYSEKLGSFILLSTYASVDFKLSHWEDYIEDRLTNSGLFGFSVLGSLADIHVAVTSRYIDHYCAGMKGSFVYIGTCRSAKDDRLVNAFLNRGAVVCIGNSETILTRYNLQMQFGILENMTKINPSTSEYYTVSAALNMAMQEFGRNDQEYSDKQGWTQTTDKAYPKVYGDSGFHLPMTVDVLKTMQPIATLAAAEYPLIAQSYNTSDFSIVGSWKSIGSYGFGQAQPGSTVTFDGNHCNFYSPYDTYSFYYQDGQWHLDCKNFLFGDVTEFTVQIVNNDYLKVDFDGSITELQRVGGSASQQTSSGQLSTEPYELLARLQSAYNNNDIYGLLECFDPTFTDAVLSVIEIMGIDSDLLLELIPFASQLIEEYGDVSLDQLGTVEFTPLSCYVDNDGGQISYRATITIPGHGSQTVEETADIVNVGGSWYFSIYDAGSIGGSDYSPDDDESIYGSLSNLTPNPTSAPIATAVPTAIPTPTSVPQTPTPSPVPTPEPTPDPTPAPTLAELDDSLEYNVEITGDKVNVRKSADRNSSVIKSGNRGDTFTYIDQATGTDGELWYNIVCKTDKAGWVSSQYSKIIIAQKTTPTPIPVEVPQGEEEYDFSDFGDEEDFDFFAGADDDELVEGFSDWENENYIGIVEVVKCDDWVSLRKKANTKSSRLAKVPKGERLEAYKCENSKFYKCYYDGKEGYILKKYLKVIE